MSKQLKRTGLTKFLIRISQDPSNTVLIDRYLALVKELPDEKEKAVHLTELAQTLVSLTPQAAMKYAFMVFEHQPSVESLEIIKQAFDLLGNTNKAEVIQKEIDKLKKLEYEEEQISLAKKQTEVASESRSFNATQIPAPSISKTQKIDITAPPPVPTAIPSDAFVNSFEENSKGQSLENQMITPPEGSLIPPPVPVLKFTDDASMSNDPPESLDFLPQNLSEPETKIGFKPQQIPTPIESGTTPNIPPSLGSSMNMQNEQSQDSDVMIELFDFYWRQNLYNEAKDLLEHSRQAYSNTPWWQARYKILENMPASKVSVQAIPTSSMGMSPQPGIPESAFIPPPFTAGAASSNTEDGSFWSYIDTLISENNFRKVLSSIRANINNDKNTEWANEAWKRLPKALEALGLQPIKWSTNDGIEDLCSKVTTYIPQKMSSIAIFF